MSERWAVCKRCLGSGEVPDFQKPVPADYVSVIPFPTVYKSKTDEAAPRYFGQECGDCYGTGFTGYSEDCPF